MWIRSHYFSGKIVVRNAHSNCCLFKVNLKCHGLENYKIPDSSYAYTTCKQTPNTYSGLAGYEVTKQTFNSFL